MYYGDFRIEKGKILEHYGDGQERFVAIPEGVIAIGAGVFSGCYNLLSVTLPEGVTTIGKEAFFDCSALEEVVLPKSLEKIGEMAFSQCDALEQIVIPNRVTVIGNEAFYGCKKLKRAYLPNTAVFSSETFPKTTEIVVNEVGEFFKTTAPRCIYLVKESMFMSPEDMAYVWFYQKKKEWMDLVKKRMVNPEAVLSELLKIFCADSSAPIDKVTKMNKFLRYYVKQLDESTISTFLKTFDEICPQWVKNLSAAKSIYQIQNSNI